MSGFYILALSASCCKALFFATGILLSQFYNPSPDTAHTSVRYIMHVPWLDFLRYLHSLSANIGLALGIVHMLRILFSHGYVPPRIGTYIVGIFLLLTAFFSYFTGTVFKWDQEGYEAMAHFIAVNKLLGPIGAVFQEDFTLSASMLARIYAMHISVLPLKGMFGDYDLGTFTIDSDDFTQVLTIPKKAEPGSYSQVVTGGEESAKVILTIK